MVSLGALAEPYSSLQASISHLWFSFYSRRLGSTSGSEISLIVHPDTRINSFEHHQLSIASLRMEPDNLHQLDPQGLGSPITEGSTDTKASVLSHEGRGGPKGTPSADSLPIDTTKPKSEDVGLSLPLLPQRKENSDEYEIEEEPQPPISYDLTESNLKVASEVFTSKQLYEVYRRKLQRDAEYSDQTTERAPRLARTFIDYINAVDERLKTVEERVGIHVDSSKKSADTDTDTHTGHVVQTKFYMATDEVPSQDSKGKDTSWGVRGSFLSEMDPRHCLRVLYTPNDSSNNNKDNCQGAEIAPEPDRIEVTEILIHSDSITSFLAKELDYDLHKDRVLLLRRPFRPLIRKMEAIREHVRSLTEPYEYVDHTSLEPMFSC